MNVPSSEAIVSYLPIIGITQAPEGNAWLKRNAMRLMEFSSLFHSVCERRFSNLLCNMNDKLVDVDPDFSKVLAPVWKSFHATIFDIQKKQREKTLMELIKEEEREKEKKVKREKKNQKRKTEKDRKILKRDDSDHIQVIVELDRASVENDLVKVLNVSQNSNENENDSASRGVLKNRKKQKAKRMINYGLDNDSECFQETADVYPETGFVENQVLNFSASPDSWTTVQTKKHTGKEKDKVKDKQELQDMQASDFSSPTKSQVKTPNKALDKRRIQRDRYQGQSACWADVAKGPSAGKLPSRRNLGTDDVPGFSYEDEFPTLTGNKGQTNDSKPQSRTNSQLSSAGQSPEDYQKVTSSCNSDGSYNPSTQSGLSPSSFCEIEPCAPDEKYYSDDEVLGYSHQPPSGDATYADWEELAEFNDTRYAAETFSTGQNAVRQVNSDTLRYLMDAYIASDDKSEAVEKFDSNVSSQNYQSASQDSANKVEEPLPPVCDMRNTDKLEVNEMKCTKHMKTDQERMKKNESRALENKFWYEETINAGNFDTLISEGLHIAQTAYARDPSPTKSPRKRFVPHKNDTFLQSRNARPTCIRNDRLQNTSKELTSNDDKFSAKETPRKVQQQQLPVQFLDHTVSNNHHGENNEQYEEISFGWDDEQSQEEELPSWYTDSGPPDISGNLDEFNDRVQNAYAGKMYGETCDLTNPTNTVASTKPTSLPDDDIANDPCIVQYWTKPDVSSFMQEFPGQVHTEVNNTASRSTRSYETKTTMHTRNSPQVNSMHDSPKGKADTTGLGQPKEVLTDDSGNKTGKKTAVVKPISQPANPKWQHARNSVNCALGQSILENAHRIDTTPDEVLFPSDLRDSSEPVPAEPDYFPSFHEDTKLSADYHPDAISVFHKIQQMQLTQLKSFYDAVHGHLQEKMSVYQNDFHYYASCTGLTEQQINEHLGISQQEETYPDHDRYQPQYVATENTCYVNPNPNPIGSKEWHPTQYAASETADYVNPNPVGSSIHHQSQDADVHIGRQSQYQNKQNAQNYQNVQTSTENMQRSKGYPVESVQINQRTNLTEEGREPNQVRDDAQANAEELKMLAAKGVADKMLDDIKAAYNAMVANAIKSRRWRDKLLDIRHMPAGDINMIGNIVFPKVNQARYIMSSRYCSGMSCVLL